MKELVLSENQFDALIEVLTAIHARLADLCEAVIQLGEALDPVIEDEGGDEATVCEEQERIDGLDGLE